MHTHPHTLPASLLHDITLRCPSQPHLVGSDEQVSQLVLRSHVIRGDIAASAAGWAQALRLLIRGCGRDVCFYVSPHLRQHVATNPRNMAVGQSVLPDRHKAGVADADCVAGTKLILAVGSRDVEGTDSWQWTMAPWAIVEHDGRLSSLWCGPREHLVSKLSSYTVEAISQALKKIIKLIFTTPPGSWSFTPLSGTDKYSHKCLN